ncbi:PIF1-like helicase domain containing protein [Tylopilus felleus]
MQDFGLPVPQQRTREVVDEMADLQRNHAMFVHDSQHCLTLLTEEQCNIFDDIMHSVLNEDPNHIMSFVEGCPGRGKTFLIQTILATLRADFHIVLVVGTNITRHYNLPFGGKKLIASSDFCQVVPVVPGCGEMATLAASMKTSHLWSKMHVYTLHAPIRTMSDSEFTCFINDIGEDITNIRRRLPFVRSTVRLDDTLQFLFPPDILHNPVQTLKRAFLSPRNIFVDAFNEKIMDLLPGESHYLYSSDALKEADNVPFNAPEQTPEYLAMLHHPGVPPHQLNLKRNAICALQRNLSVEKGLVHNAWVCISAVHRHFVEVQFPTELEHEVETHCIPRISFNFSPPGSDWTVTHKQFPLRPAYATTFNGCQELTLDRSVLDLHIDPFAHGQLYTALSCVRCRTHTLALFSESNDEKSSANIVYKNLLL